jgi:hypothetical protein
MRAVAAEELLEIGEQEPVRVGERRDAAVECVEAPS